MFTLPLTQSPPIQFFVLPLTDYRKASGESAPYNNLLTSLWRKYCENVVCVSSQACACAQRDVARKVVIWRPWELVQKPACDICLSRLAGRQARQGGVQGLPTSPVLSCCTRDVCPCDRPAQSYLHGIDVRRRFRDVNRACDCDAVKSRARKLFDGCTCIPW